MGTRGGKEALANHVYIERADGRLELRHNWKLDAVPLAVGDVIVVHSGGGGGFGEPAERDRTAIARDVVRGYVSRPAALRDYGLSDAELDELVRAYESAHTG